MVLVAKQRRLAFHLALPPLVGALLIGCAAARGIVDPTGGTGTFVAALLAAAMLLYVIGSIRTVRARAHTIVVRSLRNEQTFDGRAAAFGVSATYSGRGGATYTVYVTDGMRRSDIAAYSSRRALRVASNLTSAFANVHAGGSSEARGLVTREIEAWKAQEDDGLRQVSAFRLPLFIGLGLAVYLVVMGAVMYLDQ